MPIQNFFLQLVIILFSARLLGELAARFSIPAVIGELIAGILIGPSVLGLIELNSLIEVLAQIGIILLLFEVGLETDIGRLAQTGKKPFIAAAVGVILPFILGYLISAYIFNFNLLVSLFVGSTLTATSIGITMRVLNDLKKQSSEEAQIVLGAAVLDDIIGIILLSILYEFAHSGGVSIYNASTVLLFIGLFLVLAPITAKFISSLIKYYEEKSEIPGLLPATIVSLLLFFAWLAHTMGAPELLGGFAAGLALSKRFPLGKLTDKDLAFSDKVHTQMAPIIHLFSPIFFVTVGLSLNFHKINWDSSYIWILSSLLLIGAVIGKLASGFFLFKESKWIKWAVGLAMVPRGEVGLVFAEIGRENKVFDGDLYAAMLIVIALTTVVTPFILRLFYNYAPSNTSARI